MTESTKNVILVPTAAHLKLVSRPLAARVTGNGTKTRSITRSKRGGVMNTARIRSNSVPRSFIGESNSMLTWRRDIKSMTKIISVSNSRGSRLGTMGRRDFGVGFVKRLSSWTNRDSMLGTSGSIISTIIISKKVGESTNGTSSIEISPTDSCGTDTFWTAAFHPSTRTRRIPTRAMTMGWMIHLATHRCTMVPTKPFPSIVLHRTGIGRVTTTKTMMVVVVELAHH